MKIMYMWECKNDCLRLKGEGHSKKHPFLFSPIAKNIQLYHSPKFRHLKCLLSWRNSSWKKWVQGGCHFETVFGSQAVFMWCHSVWLDISGEEKNLQLTQHPSQGQQNVFCPSDYPLHVLHCCHIRSLDHVWPQIIILLLKSSHNPLW